MQTLWGRQDLWSIPMSEERAVVHRAVLTWMEVRAPSTSAPRKVAGASVIMDCVWHRLCPKGCLELVDWTTGLEYWNGLTHSVISLTCSMPCLGILPQTLGGQRLLHTILPWNIEARVRLSLVLFSHLTCSKHVEVCLWSLVTTIVFLGLQTFHLARAPRKRTKATSHTYTVRHRY